MVSTSKSVRYGNPKFEETVLIWFEDIKNYDIV